MKAEVLLIDDDAGMGEYLVAQLRRLEFAPHWCGDPHEALRLLESRDFAVVVTDMRMKGLDGIQVCERIVAAHPNVPVIVMTAFGSMDSAVAAIRVGAHDFLAKPFEIEALVIALERALRHRRLREEVTLLRQELAEARPFGEILGRSPRVQELCQLLEKVAQTDASVLVQGETGTGKELAARAIHGHGPRRAQRFVAINCAAMPEALLESELFGHAQGAFTDAKQAREGLMQRATGGSLFLDEIGDMPLGLQAKLLRVLQERSVRPVGSDREIPIDVRLIAATHEDLEAAVERGSFREDLLYRINVIQVDLPPLRDRENDVLLLAQHFLQRFAERNAKQVTGISSAAAEKLLHYDWPGNVRELSNCVERAVALTNHDKIVVDDLPPKVRSYLPAQHTSAEPDDELLPLQQVERRHILRVLEATGGNKARAARILGLDRRTLYRKLELYQREPQDSA